MAAPDEELELDIPDLGYAPPVPVVAPPYVAPVPVAPGPVAAAAAAALPVPVVPPGGLVYHIPGGPGGPGGPARGPGPPRGVPAGGWFGAPGVLAGILAGTDYRIDNDPGVLLRPMIQGAYPDITLNPVPRAPPPGAPGGPRGPPPGPPPPPPAAVVAELNRIKTFLNAVPGRKPAAMTPGQLIGLVQRASEDPAVAAIAAAVPFNVGAYRAAILPALNAALAAAGGAGAFVSVI